MLDFRFLKTLLSRRFGGGRGVPFVLDPIAVGSGNKTRLLQMVAASLGGRGLRRFGARRLKLRRLPRKPGVDQLEAAGAVFFSLKADRVESGLGQLRLAPKRFLLRLERVQIASKLIEAASIGIGIGDGEFRRRGGRAPVRILLSRRLNDAFDGRTDRIDSRVDDRLDARRREHGAKRRPAERDDKADAERDLQETTDADAKGEALFFRRFSLDRLSFPGVRRKATLQNRLHRACADWLRLFPRLDSARLDRLDCAALCDGGRIMQRNRRPRRGSGALRVSGTRRHHV